MSFIWQNRLQEKPSELLKHYYADALREPVFLEAMHAWDKAQVVVLAEQKIAPPDAVRCLAQAVSQMEQEGVVEARATQWNVIHGGEEYLRNACDEDRSGWLHVGRSSASIRSVASRIAFRSLLLQAKLSICELRAALIETADRYVETVMPGYSYIQQTEPCTFGFYLMSFVPPLERDFQRIASAYRNTNVSAVGTGGGLGIEFPIDLERLDELLGFDAEPLNARDAVRNYDYLIEAYTAIALMHNSLGRLALDLLIWHSAEFGMVELPDRLSITSSIAPQKKIPYVLEFIHGVSGLLTGRLVEALAVNKTASDQLEAATMLPAEFWHVAQESRYAIVALCDALRGLRVNADRMLRLANDHWAQASALIAFLVKEKGLSYRTSHQLLSRLMQRVMKAGVKPSQLPVEWLEQAALEYTGRPVHVTQESLRAVLDAARCVGEKTFRAGTAPERVREHIARARSRLAEDRHAVDSSAERIALARNKLDSAFEAVRSSVSNG